MGVKSLLKNVLPASRRYIERRFNEQEKKLDSLLECTCCIIDRQKEMLDYLSNILDVQTAIRNHQDAIDDELMKAIGKSNECHKLLYQEITSAHDEISENISECVKICSEQNNKDKDIADSFNGLDIRLMEIWNSISDSVKTIFWKNEFEKRIVKENWGDISKNLDFTQLYLRLIKGMDDDSITQIQKILSRQHSYLNNNSKRINLYTQKEQDELRELNDNFYSAIFEINDQLFAYKKYLLPINHFEPSVFYYKHGLNKLLIPDDLKEKSLIDVGGFIGDSLLILCELPHKNIYSFEPDPDNYALLKKTIQLNRVKNVICENLALSSKTEKLLLHRKGAMSTICNRLGVSFEGDIEVNSVTLDEYVKLHNIQCGLIKIDIEGAEATFLEGAKETIKSQKPILLISIYHNAHDFFEIKPMIESWNLGYKYMIHNPTDGNTTSETLLIAYG